MQEVPTKAELDEERRRLTEGIRQITDQPWYWHFQKDSRWRKLLHGETVK